MRHRWPTTSTRHTPPLAGNATSQSLPFSSFNAIRYSVLADAKHPDDEPPPNHLADPATCVWLCRKLAIQPSSHPTSRLATYLAIHQSIHQHVYIDMRTSIHALPPTMRNAICMSTCLYVYLRVRYLRTSHTRGDNPTQCLVWHTPRATIESDD